ncbi:MAG: ATP-binding cassette domain-containing protein [Planctomycetota bacterium]|nr:MAG: ATP-binding cassette domain-containing protein [Planctomycetota bacterium]
MLDAIDLTRAKDGDPPLLIHRIRLSLRAGDRLALIGPSGSGKTILLRALAFLDPLDEGAIFWRGEQVGGNRVPVFRSRVVYLHQRPDWTAGTVEQVLREPLSLEVHRHRAFSRDRIVGWLSRLGRSASFLEQSTRDLSGGELQLLALMRIVQLDPNILLLDEPTAALDPTTTSAVEGWLMDWCDQAADRAYVWVTHDMVQATRVSRRVIRMERGELVAPTATPSGLPQSRRYPSQE